MYRTLLIIFAVGIILIPFTGIPGGVEDVLMQIFAAIVLVLIILLPKSGVKKEVAEEPYEL